MHVFKYVDAFCIRFREVDGCNFKGRFGIPFEASGGGRVRQHNFINRAAALLQGELLISGDR